MFSLDELNFGILKNFSLFVKQKLKHRLLQEMERRLSHRHTLKYFCITCNIPSKTKLNNN